MLRAARLLGRMGPLTCGFLGLLVASCSPKPHGGGTGGEGGGGISGASGTGGDANLTGTATGTTSSGASNCDPGSTDLTGCACSPGTAPRDCYDGNPAMAGKGACNMGKQECKTVNMNEFMGGVWEACLGAGKPSPEVCNGQGDEDCDGVIDNGCGCMEGAQQMCNLPNGGTGSQTCLMGQWGPCGCMEGTSQACITAQGDPGMQTCTNQTWSPCVGGMCGGPITAGQPCSTPGTSLATPPNTCGCGDQGTSVTAIYCDNLGTWQCFPADDCNPAACAPCLQTHCSQYMQSAVPACQANLTLATTFLEGCGPDRTAWFTTLDQGCPNNEVSQLNQCKFTYCVMNGTCSFY